MMLHAFLIKLAHCICCFQEKQDELAQSAKDIQVKLNEKCDLLDSKKAIIEVHLIIVCRLMNSRNLSTSSEFFEAIFF